MSRPSVYECKRRCNLAEDEQLKNNRSTNDHADQPPYLCDNGKTLASQSSSQAQVATSLAQVFASDDKNNIDSRVRDLESERHAPRQEMHRGQGDNQRPSSIQLPEYCDIRDNSIIHVGVIGTHEGKTFIPKRSVHRNALDDLAHPYDEDQDFYVLDVNLDGDQIDHLLHCSEIYYAEGEYTSFLQKTADCLLTVL